MISYKRKFLFGTVILVIAALIAGAGSPVKVLLGFAALANLFYGVAILLFLVGVYYLVIGFKMSYEYKNSDTRKEGGASLDYDQKKRSLAKKSFIVAAVVYFVSWFILTGASSAKIANESDKEPIVIYALGFIGILVAFYLTFKGARYFYWPIATANE